jgi:1-acyl-sn-glycerol-3-phosphate acyltransferase
MKESIFKQIWIRIRFVFQFIAIGFVTVYYTFRVYPLSFIKDGAKAYQKYLKNWCRLLLKIAGVKVEIIGREFIDKDCSYIFVSNHSSLFDIPVLLGNIEVEVRIMYKKELEKIPIFGRGLRRSPLIAVTREDPRNAMKGIEEALNAVRENSSVVVFPEGTRSKDGNLGTFKRGAFMLASRSGKPIIPVAIIGTNQIMPAGSLYFKPKEVKLIFNEQLMMKNQGDRMEEKKFMEEVRNVIKNCIDTNP